MTRDELVDSFYLGEDIDWGGEQVRINGYSVEIDPCGVITKLITRIQLSSKKEIVFEKIKKIPWMLKEDNGNLGNG